MSTDVNLADPTIEPRDESLRQLSREAFAEVKERQREALARLQSLVALRRADALAYATRLRARGAGDQR